MSLSDLLRWSRAFQSETKPQHIFPLNCAIHNAFYGSHILSMSQAPPPSHDTFSSVPPTSSRQRQRPQFVTSCPAVDWEDPSASESSTSWGSQMAFSPFCGNVCPRKQCHLDRAGWGVLPGGYAPSSLGFNPFRESCPPWKGHWELLLGGRIASLSFTNLTVSARTLIVVMPHIDLLPDSGFVLFPWRD